MSITRPTSDMETAEQKYRLRKLDANSKNQASPDVVKKKQAQPQNGTCPDTSTTYRESGCR